MEDLIIGRRTKIRDGPESASGIWMDVDTAPPDPEVAVVAPREDLPPHPLLFYDDDSGGEFSASCEVARSFHFVYIRHKTRITFLIFSPESTSFVLFVHSLTLTARLSSWPPKPGTSVS